MNVKLMSRGYDLPLYCHDRHERSRCFWVSPLVFPPSDDHLTYSRKSRQEKITRIYAFIRHPIGTVRLAVARVLQTFTTAPLLSSAAWHSPTLFALLFQNLVLEERPEIRSISYAALVSALEIANQRGSDTLRDLIEDNLGDWYQIVMTPPGAKIEPSLLTRVAKSSSSHNVDKAMLEGDLSLVDVETVMETRLLGAKALATLRQYGASEVRRPVCVCVCVWVGVGVYDMRTVLIR